MFLELSYEKSSYIKYENYSLRSLQRTLCIRQSPCWISKLRTSVDAWNKETSRLTYWSHRLCLESCRIFCHLSTTNTKVTFASCLRGPRQDVNCQAGQKVHRETQNRIRWTNNYTVYCFHDVKRTPVYFMRNSTQQPPWSELDREKSISFQISTWSKT